MNFEKLIEKLGLINFISPETFKNISTLMTGTVFSAIIPILTAPVMSRLFTATDYGILGLYMSISGLIGVIAYSHYSNAIMLPKEDEEAKQVVWFSVYISSAVSLITLLIFIILSVYTDIIKNSSVVYK